MKKNLIPALLFILIVGGILGYAIYSNGGSSGAGAKQKVDLQFQPDTGTMGGGQTLSTSTTPEDGVLKNADPNATKYSYLKNTCLTASSEFSCLSDYYKKTVANYGATVAISDIKQRAKDNSNVLALCHPLMHVIGREAANSYKSIAVAFSKGDSYCWSGYHHGIMEGMVAKISLKNLPSQLNGICADIPGKEKYTFDYYNCVHGLGHGIMAELEDDVFKSLNMCDNLSGDWEQQSCYSGIFMQNIIDSTKVADSGFVSKDLKPNEPLYPCTSVNDRYKGQCYLGQTSYALQVNGYNFSKVFGLCATVNEPYRDICNQSMGRDIANQASHEPTLTRNNCSLPKNDNDTINCIIGAAKEIISYYHSDKQAKDFCAILDTKYQTSCKNTVTSYYANF
jgi:hypothetical protein